jgi:hypothetical protein
MKEIITINQFALVQLGITGVSFDDMAIFDVFMDSIARGVLDHALIDGKDYWIFPYNLILSQLPILDNPSQKTIHRNLSRLCRARLMDRCGGNTKLQAVYLGLGDMGESLMEIDYCGRNEYLQSQNSVSISSDHISGLRRKAPILDRDGYKCLKCGTTKWLVIDHVLPRSKGGSSNPINLQTLCFTCNAKKGDEYHDYREFPTPLDQMYIVRPHSEVLEANKEVMKP